MLADVARIETTNTGNGDAETKGKDVHRELKTKEEIMNYVKGLQ